MNRYDHHFRALPTVVRVNAAQKVGFARSGIVEHRSNGFGPEDDDKIVRQFDLSGMGEFWDVVLSEPMLCDDFAHALAIHFMVIEHKLGGTDADRLASGPAASRVVDAVRAQLRSALRQARIDSEPWFIALPHQDEPRNPAPAYREVLIYSVVIGPPKKDYALVLPPDPPADGVDLARLKVRPRPAVEWLLAMPMRRHLVPPSLVTALQPQSLMAVVADTSAAPPTSGVPGRPTSTHLVMLRLAERATRGEVLKTCKAEADWLSAWLQREHPAMPQVGGHRLQSVIASEYRSISKSIPK